MTEIDSYTLPATPQPHTYSTTIYRDTLLTNFGARAFQPVRSSVRVITTPDRRVADVILLALAALTLPAALYSLEKVLSLVASGSLDQAIRAFVS